MWQYGDGSFPEVGVTFFAGTYIRHPLTMAASWAILNHLKREGEGLQTRSQRTRTRRPSARSTISPNKAACRCDWSIFPRSSCRILRTTSNNGSLLFRAPARQGRPYPGRAARAFFSTAHTDADIAFIVQAFKNSISEVAGGRIFAR